MHKAPYFFSQHQNIKYEDGLTSILKIHIPPRRRCRVYEFCKTEVSYFIYILIFCLMKEKLLALLEENKGTITEAVINEILDEKKPLQRLLDFDA